MNDPRFCPVLNNLGNIFKGKLQRLSVGGVKILCGKAGKPLLNCFSIYSIFILAGGKGNGIKSRSLIMDILGNIVALFRIAERWPANISFRSVDILIIVPLRRRTTIKSIIHRTGNKGGLSCRFVLIRHIISGDAV